MRKFVRRTERREAAQVKTVESTGSYANASRRALSASRSDIPAALAARRQHDRQIEATIKELFPKIPNADLVAIVERAWAKVGLGLIVDHDGWTDVFVGHRPGGERSGCDFVAEGTASRAGAHSSQVHSL